MKQIELKLKTHSKTWITPVLLIFIAFFAMAMVSPINAAPPIQCDPESFCDQDGDGITRDYKKCLKACGGPADCDDNVYNEDNICNGGSGGGYIQTNSRNDVIWGDRSEGVPYELVRLGKDNDELGPASPRYCAGDGSEEPNPNPQGGVGYICHQDHSFLYGREQWNVVYLDLSALTLDEGPWQLEADGRDKELCARLTDEEEWYFTDEEEKYFPMAIIPAKDPLDCMGSPDPYCDTDNEPKNYGRNSSYFITLHESNDEPCTVDSNPENSCKVVIALRGYFHNERNESGNKSGRLIGLQAWGHVKQPSKRTTDDKIEINPFTRNQDITIEELTVYFRGIGTNRTVASCYFDNRVYDDDTGAWTGGFVDDYIVFRTICDGKGCKEPPPTE